MVTFYCPRCTEVYRLGQVSLQAGSWRELGDPNVVEHRCAEFHAQAGHWRVPRVTEAEMHELLKLVEAAVLKAVGKPLFGPGGLLP